MSYATLSQLTERYSERELRHITDPDAQQLDVTRAQEALNDACAEIDGWLATRYALPLQDLNGAPLPTPPLALVRCACDIAIYRLQTLRAADDIKDARQRYEDVLKLLKALANGEVTYAGIKLRADVTDNPANQAIGLPQFGTSSSPFGRDSR